MVSQRFCTMSSKSRHIREAGLCRVIVILCGLAIIFTNAVVSEVTTRNSETRRSIQSVIQDLPQRRDMEVYLMAMEKLVFFIDKHKVYVDGGMYFGLFLIKVNLKSCIDGANKIPVKIKSRIRTLLNFCDMNIKGFLGATHKLLETFAEKNLTMAAPFKELDFRLTLDEMKWQKYLRKFNTDLLKDTKFYTRKEMEEIYSKWPQYRKMVLDFEKYSPTPKENDICLDLLAQNTNKELLANCELHDPCVKSIVYGSDYGYVMTLRLIFLIKAACARGCLVISPTADKELKESLCAMMYTEVEFIANHDFEMPDLIFHRIALCTLDGHAQFLRRSWIQELLVFQTKFGCFNVSRPVEEDFNHILRMTINDKTWPYQSLKHGESIFGGSCHGPTTAGAGAMLASAIRYIVQKKY